MRGKVRKILEYFIVKVKYRGRKVKKEIRLVWKYVNYYSKLVY